MAKTFALLLTVFLARTVVAGEAPTSGADPSPALASPKSRIRSWKELLESRPSNDTIFKPTLPHFHAEDSAWIKYLETPLPSPSPDRLKPLNDADFYAPQEDFQPKYRSMWEALNAPAGDSTVSHGSRPALNGVPQGKSWLETYAPPGRAWDLSQPVPQLQQYDWTSFKLEQSPLLATPPHKTWTGYLKLAPLLWLGALAGGHGLALVWTGLCRLARIMRG